MLIISNVLRSKIYSFNINNQREPYTLEFTIFIGDFELP